MKANVRVGVLTVKANVRVGVLTVKANVRVGILTDKPFLCQKFVTQPGVSDTIHVDKCIGLLQWGFF